MQVPLWFAKYKHMKNIPQMWKFGLAYKKYVQIIFESVTDTKLKIAANFEKPKCRWHRIKGDNRRVRETAVYFIPICHNDL